MNDNTFRIVKDETRLQFRNGEVVERTIADPNNVESSRDMVHRIPAVAVVAIEMIDDVPHVVLENIYRSAMRGRQIEIPAGRIEPGLPGEPAESPEQCAQRELQEEVGRRADEWTLLGTIFPSPGWTDETVTFFLAEGITHVDSQPDGPEEVFMDVFTIPLREAVKQCDDGVITDAKTIIGCLKVDKIFGQRTEKPQPALGL